jgi:hypothetical protein
VLGAAPLAGRAVSQLNVLQTLINGRQTSRSPQAAFLPKIALLCYWVLSTHKSIRCACSICAAYCPLQSRISLQRPNRHMYREGSASQQERMVTQSQGQCTSSSGTRSLIYLKAVFGGVVLVHAQDVAKRVHNLAKRI